MWKLYNFTLVRTQIKVFLTCPYLMKVIQKRIVRTEFDIYIFITTNTQHLSYT